jgi:hypothetical protein
MDFEKGFAIEINTMSNLLASKIASVRRKHALFTALRGLSAMLGVAVLLLAIGMLLDWYIELPWRVRAAILAIDLTVLTYMFLTFVIAPIIWGPDEDEAALMVERERPEFATRLIASVQLGRPGAVAAGASPAIVRAMIAQTEEIAAPIIFSDVVKTEPLIKTAAASFLVVVLGAAFFVYGSDVSQDLLARAMLGNVDVPRKTRVEEISKDAVVAIGDAFTIEARARGINPDNGTVKLTYGGDRTQQFQIAPLPNDSRHFSRTVENVQESFKYQIHLNDGHGKLYEVKALPRPSVVSVEFVQQYPPYTRKKPERRSPGDLSLLAGSQLTLKVKASKAVKDGQIKLVGLNKDLPLRVDPANATELTGTVEIPAKGLTGLSIRLQDEYGIQSRGETIYPIDLVPDRDPVVRITWPDRKEELATQQAKILVAFEAADDFGVGKIFLRYKIDTVANGAEKFIEMDLTQENPDELRNVRRRYEFDLAALRPSALEGSNIEYWIEVQDGNNVTGPGVASSDRFRVRIVSEIEKRADLMNRLNDQLGAIDFVAEDQEKLSQALGALIHAKSGGNPATRPAGTR